MPEGRVTWTARMLANRLVELPVVERVSEDTILRVFGRKNALKPWQKRSWCLPKGVDGEFVYRMEEVLELYAEPYDPARPVVGCDEASKELRGEVAEPVPPAPGSPAKRDYEYTREETANLFVAVEPLAGRRHMTVTDHRTIPDFSEQLRRLCDALYPEAEVIRVVLDNLNTQALGSLCATYPPQEAWRLTRRLESTTRRSTPAG